MHKQCWENVWKRYQAVQKGKGKWKEETMSTKELNLIGTGGDIVEFFDGNVHEMLLSPD